METRVTQLAPVRPTRPLASGGLANTDTEIIELRLNTGVSTGPLTNWSGADTDAKLIELWLNAKESKRTQKEYARIIRDFLAFANKPLRELTLADLQAYGAAMDAKGLSDASKRQRQMAIKSLLSFGSQTGYLRLDVGRAWKAIKETEKIAERILTEGEVIQLINAAKSPRDRTLLRFLYKTGARVSEVSSLTWKQIRIRDGGGAVVTIRGKGNKLRHVRISDKTLAELTKLNPSRQGPVFVSKKRKPLSPVRIWAILRELGERTLGKPVSPHWLRHSHATHTLRRGLRIQDVAANLGHGSIAVTGRYLHQDPETCPEEYLPEV